MKAIFTKFIPATNTRGSRIKAYDEDKNTLSIPYPHESNTEDGHRQAAEAFIRKMKWNPTRIVGAAMKTGYVWMLEYRPGVPVETYKVNPRATRTLIPKRIGAGSRYVACNGRKNEYGEYVCRLYVDGKHQKDADYFTDDAADAAATMRAMYYGPQKNPRPHRHRVRRSGQQRLIKRGRRAARVMSGKKRGKLSRRQLQDGMMGARQIDYSREAFSDADIPRRPKQKFLPRRFKRNPLPAALKVLKGLEALAYRKNARTVTTKATGSVLLQERRGNAWHLLCMMKNGNDAACIKVAEKYQKRHPRKKLRLIRGRA